MFVAAFIFNQKLFLFFVRQFSFIPFVLLINFCCINNFLDTSSRTNLQIITISITFSFISFVLIIFFLMLTFFSICFIEFSLFTFIFFTSYSYIFHAFVISPLHFLLVTKQNLSFQSKYIIFPRRK
jgi:hypothetical protein